MKNLFVQTTLYERDLDKILNMKVIGRTSKAIGFQPPKFKDKPLIFCSYLCEEYTETYGNREGIIFEPEFKVVYACPVDTFELMRGGNWLPGHEKFIFESIKDMLKKYPNPADFKKDFKEYFKNLKPGEVYPDHSSDYAEQRHEFDYCLKSSWALGCNEITFPKPLKIKNPKIFRSREELEGFF